MILENIAPTCSFLLCSLLIFSDVPKKFKSKIPRDITYLDMIGSYVITMFVTLFLSGFIRESNKIYVFPMLYEDYHGYSSMTIPYDRLSLLPNAFIGFVLCLAITYTLITIILRIPLVNNISDRKDSIIGNIFGYNPNASTKLIKFVFIISSIDIIGITIRHNLYETIELVIGHFLFFLSYITPVVLVTVGNNISKMINIPSLDISFPIFNIINVADGCLILFGLGLLYVLLSLYSNYSLNFSIQRK